MQILYYFWNENSCQDMIDTLEGFGHQVTVFQAPLTNYLTDDVFSQALEQELSYRDYDFIFTFNYFPIISDTAMRCSVRYVCWVYDCPHFTLFSKSVQNECNYMFLFDRNMVGDVLAIGAKHAYHLPLAANTHRLNDKLKITPEQPAAPESYMHDISFVGSLYENNLYDRVNYLPDGLSGYLEGIMAAQKQVWGMDLISALMDSRLCEDIAAYVKLEDNPHLIGFQQLIFTDMLQNKITSDERIAAVNLLAKHFPVTLYSSSPRELCPNATYGGYISYLDSMPEIFFKSKLNLNVSLRSITSGIPLRCIDILSCGGFLLTNYQPELTEYFEAGGDFVYFEDMDDLISKADYYLSHEKERQEIAANGYRRASLEFSYERQVGKILEKL